MPREERDTHADRMCRRGAVRERCAYSPWQFHVNKCRDRGVAPSQPASLPASQPAPAAPLAGTNGARAAGSPARIRGVAMRPIAALLEVTAGQSAHAAVTTRAKYSRYISRPVATANYPQSRAGGRRRRLSGCYLERRADLSACAVREVRIRLPDTGR